MTPGGAQRRGEALRRHILLEAKDVFLETGFERTTMDAVAARAGTSKRSLYAHYASKDALFQAVLDLIRELYLGTIRTPDTYADAPADAVALFCGRFQQMMVWEGHVRTLRLCVSEAVRLPASAHAYFDATYASTRERLARYLAAGAGREAAAADALAGDLIGRTVLPRVMRTLLGVEEPIRGALPPDEAKLPEDVDMDAVRRVVAETLPQDLAAS